MMKHKPGSKLEEEKNHQRWSLDAEGYTEQQWKCWHFQQAMFKDVFNILTKLVIQSLLFMYVSGTTLLE